MHVPAVTSILDEECDGMLNLPTGAEAAGWDAQFEQAWQDFNAGLEPEFIRPAIRRSWQASREAGVDPSTFHYRFPDAAELKNILATHAEMIDVAGSIMHSLLAYNPDGHINLTDANGVTLCYCGLDLTPVGSILRESVLGTNSTARCLNEQRLVYVLSGENWKRTLRQRHQQCASAPVRNAEGRMTGVLTLTASQDNFHYHTLGTVQAAAEAIGHQMELRRLLAEQKSILETLNEGVIVTDERGMIKISNRYARQIFHGMMLSGKSADAVLNPEDVSLIGMTFCNDREVVFNPPGCSTVSCLVSVMPAPDGGRIVSLRDNQRIRAITHRLMGMGASYTFDMICGCSSALSAVLEKARTSSRSDSTVLLTGESGTGKELFAQAIHNGSARHGGPFIAVNCGALPRDLVQSELFGYVDGAFTGSRRGGTAGKFELADGGTLFLDEIGDMPLEAQTSLLRVLQESEVMRIGATRPVKVNVRIIAATNCDLLRAIETGAFRRDLFYRLNVITLRIPPLRERADDVPQLVEWFSEKMCARLKKAGVRFSPDAMEALSRYRWPGNVRELENVVERVINLSDKLWIDQEDLPEEMTAAPLQSHRVCDPRLDSNEREHIVTILASLQGNLRKTARIMGVSRAGLYNKLKKHGINIDEFRA